YPRKGLRNILELDDGLFFHAFLTSGNWKSQLVAPAEAVSCTDVAVRGDRVYVAYGDVAERAVYLAVLGITE
ncbi:MAG: hypothetical protein R6X33_14050, partial [Candidatus Brocadiia bacterium]